MYRRTGKKTRKSVPWSGWKNEKPSFIQRTNMLQQCGKKCFLGPHKSFPICKKNTCKISEKGLWAAYIRSKQWGKSRKHYKKRSTPTMKRKVYKRIANKSKRMLRKRGHSVN